MSKSKKENKGLVFTSIGMLCTTVGLIFVSLKNYENIALMFTVLGVLFALYGVFRILKANKVNEKNL